MFFFEANVKDEKKIWPRMGRYQNSTLRYSPGKDFPEFLEKVLGRPEIMRCFLTLNDAWDYRSGEYHYDFVLGEDIYKDDPTVDAYDRAATKLSPYGLTYLEHLKSHAEHADYICLSVRRYEREVVEGKIAIDKYEEVFEHLLEYYKNMVPNIRYVEGNEQNNVAFGELTAFETYELYKRMYRVVNRLNKKYQYEIPLEVGGPTFADATGTFRQHEEFLRLYAHDSDPEKRMDYYSSHEYTTDATHLPNFFKNHNELIQKLGLPKLPFLFNEFGTECFCPDIYYNQLHAADSIEMFIGLAEWEDFKVFPWCPYHDPSLQVSHTMFIDFDRTCGYLPTFLGQAHIAFSRLLNDMIPIEGNIGNKAVVTTDGENYAVLATNRDKQVHNIRFGLNNLEGTKAKVEVYKVDAMHNNCFIDKTVDDLKCTDAFDAEIKDGRLIVADELDVLGFALWLIKPEMA